MAVFEPVPASARGGIARLRLDRVLDSVMAATEEFVASEKAYRNAHRKALIGAELTDLEAQAENAHNELGLHHLATALNEIDNMNNVGQGDKQQFDRWLAGRERQQAFDRARSSFGEQLAAHDLHPDDMREILDRWDTETRQVTSFESLINVLRQRATEARDLRRQPNRGRESGSLPVWKITVIAIALGVAAGAVVACFVWFGCAWVAAMLSWLAPSLNALIQSGC